MFKRGIKRALRALVYAYLSHKAAGLAQRYGIPIDAGDPEAIVTAVSTAVCMGADKIVRDKIGPLLSRIRG